MMSSESLVTDVTVVVGFLPDKYTINKANVKTFYMLISKTFWDHVECLFFSNVAIYLCQMSASSDQEERPFHSEL